MYFPIFKQHELDKSLAFQPQSNCSEVPYLFRWLSLCVNSGFPDTGKAAAWEYRNIHHPGMSLLRLQLSAAGLFAEMQFLHALHFITDGFEAAGAAVRIQTLHDFC